MSAFQPRAIEECPGWIQMSSLQVTHWSTFKTGTFTDAVTLAAAQRLEWRAKRLAELEAEAEHERAVIDAVLKSAPKPTAWGPLERLRNDATKDPQRQVLFRSSTGGTFGVCYLDECGGVPGDRYAEIPR